MIETIQESLAGRFDWGAYVPRTKPVAPVGTRVSGVGPVYAAARDSGISYVAGSVQGGILTDQGRGDWSAFTDSGLSGVVRGLGAFSGRVYAVGDFAAAGADPRDGLAAFSSQDGSLIPLVGEGLSPAGKLGAVTEVGGLLFVAGDFTSLGGFSREKVAQLDRDTGEVLPWEAGSILGMGTVHALLGYQGGLYVAHDVGILAFDPAGGDLFGGWDDTTEADGPVWALGAFGSLVLAGGGFSGFWTITDDDQEFQGQPYLAALDASTGSLLNWSPEVPGPVKSLVVDGTTVYCGGDWGVAGYHVITGEKVWAPAGSPGAVRALGRGSLLVGGEGGLQVFPGHLHAPGLPQPTPDAPDVVGFRGVRRGVIRVVMPRMPYAATSLALERSIDDIDYSRVADGLGAKDEYRDFGLPVRRNYFYRAVSMNDSGEATGMSSGVYLPRS